MRDDELADELADEPDDAEPLIGRRRAGCAGLAHGRPAVRSRVRLAGPRSARGRPTRTHPTSRPSCAVTSRSSGPWWPVDVPVAELAARTGAAAPQLARSAGRRADPRRDRAGRPALRARLRDPAGRGRHRARRRRGPRRRRRAARPSTWPPTTRCVPTPRGCRRPGSAASRCAATCPAPSTSCSGCPGRTVRATSSPTTRPTGSARPTSRSPRLHTPGRGWWRRCCTPTTPCRRCSTSSSCTATCAGASPATTRRGTSAGCSTSTSVACAAPRRPRTTATRPGSSRGSRRPRS